MKRCGRCGEPKATCQQLYRLAYNERQAPGAIAARVKEHTKRYRARNRAFVDAYLDEHPCIDCGLDDPIVLEFDHVRGDKVAAIGVMIRDGVPLVRLQREILKCVVRCANCHRRRTAQRWVHRRPRRQVSSPAIPKEARRLGDCSSVG